MKVILLYILTISFFHTSLADLHALTHKVLQRLEKYNLYLKPEKCFFDQTSIKYLDVVISKGNVCMDLNKVQRILKWPRPKTVKQIQSFLSFCNFYRHFIHNYFKRAHPLFQLTKVNIPFNWTSLQQDAFMTLIHIFNTARLFLFKN